MFRWFYQNYISTEGVPLKGMSMKSRSAVPVRISSQGFQSGVSVRGSSQPVSIKMPQAIQFAGGELSTGAERDAEAVLCNLFKPSHHVRGQPLGTAT